MDTMVAEEINRLNASAVMSEFEVDVANDIYIWGLFQDVIWESYKHMIDAFWKEQLQ